MNSLPFLMLNIIQTSYTYGSQNVKSSFALATLGIPVVTSGIPINVEFHMPLLLGLKVIWTIHRLRLWLCMHGQVKKI